jgi:hypothetical protein
LGHLTSYFSVALPRSWYGEIPVVSTDLEVPNGVLLSVQFRDAQGQFPDFGFVYEPPWLGVQDLTKFLKLRTLVIVASDLNPLLSAQLSGRDVLLPSLHRLQLSAITGSHLPGMEKWVRDRIRSGLTLKSLSFPHLQKQEVDQSGRASLRRLNSLLSSRGGQLRMAQIGTL